MADKIETTKVSPRYEPKTYEVEVYMAFYPSGQPFVSCSIVGGQYSIGAPSVPKGGQVKRYVFEVTAPQLQQPSELEA